MSREFPEPDETKAAFPDFIGGARSCCNGSNPVLNGNHPSPPREQRDHGWPFARLS